MKGRKHCNKQNGGGQEPPSTLFGLSASRPGFHSEELSRMGVAKSFRAGAIVYLREANGACQGAACSHSRPSASQPVSLLTSSPPGNVPEGSVLVLA